MGLSDLPLLKAGWLGKARSMVNSPARACDTLRLTEVDTVELITLPQKLGWCDDEKFEWSFRTNHALKVRLMPTGQLVQLYSERSYYPLDPFDRFKGEPEDMNEIARMMHSRACERVFRNKTTNAKMSFKARVVTFFFVIDILCLLIYVLRTYVA